jgi:hypothetical protein
MSISLRSRLIGLGITAIGLAFAWFFGFRPLQAAAAGASEVEFQIKLFVAAPLAIVSGLFLMLGGQPVGEAMSGPPVGRQQHLIVWSMFLIAMAAGGASYYWFDAKLHALGYVSG